MAGETAEYMREMARASKQKGKVLEDVVEDLPDGRVKVWRMDGSTQVYGTPAGDLNKAAQQDAMNASTKGTSRGALFKRRQKQELKAAEKVVEAEAVSAPVANHIAAEVHKLPKKDLELLLNESYSPDGNRTWVALRSMLGRPSQALDPAIRVAVAAELKEREKHGAPDRVYSERAKGTAKGAVPPPGAAARKAMSTGGDEVHALPQKKFLTLRQPSGKRRDEGPETNFYETPVTKPQQEELLVLAASAMGKDPNGINRALRDLTGSRISKVQADKLQKNVKRGMAEGGWTDLQLAKALLFLKQNPGEREKYYGLAQTKFNEDEIAKEQAELDRIYGRKMPPKEARVAPVQEAQEPAKATKVVATVNAVDPVVRAAKKSWPGLAPMYARMALPRDPLKGVRFLGKLVRLTPAWLPGFFVAVLVLGAANLVWEFYALEGVTPGTLYAMHTLLALLAVVANMFLVMVNASVYGFSAFGNVILLGLLEVVVQAINWALSPLFAALTGAGIDVQPWSFENTAKVGPLFQLSYLTPGFNGSCGGEILHFQGCAKFIVPGGSQLDLKFNKPDIQFSPRAFLGNAVDSAKGGAAGAWNWVKRGGVWVWELVS